MRGRATPRRWRVASRAKGRVSSPVQRPAEPDARRTDHVLRGRGAGPRPIRMETFVMEPESASRGAQPGQVRHGVGPRSPRAGEWRAFAAVISDVCGSAAVVVAGAATEDHGGVIGVGIAPEHEQVYGATGGSMDPWLAASVDVSEGTLLEGHVLVPVSAVAAGELCRAWLEPQGLDPEKVLVGVLSRANGHPPAYIRIFGRAGGPAWSARGLAQARVLTAQLSRLLRVEREVRRLHDERDAIAGALDAIPQPVVVVDAEARVIGINASARRFLAPHQCADCSGCLLYTSRRAADAAMQRAVTAVAVDPGGEVPEASRRTVTLSCPNGQGGISLTVGLLGRHAPSRHGGAVAAVVLGASREELQKDAAPLFCLTPAEARLAQWVAEGRSLKEAAAAFGVSIHTVRMQLRSIFAKTGTRRQAELVRLMFGG